MNEREEHVLLWLRLARVPGLGPIMGARLITAFGSVEAVLAAGREELYRIEGMRQEIARAIADSSGQDAAWREYEDCCQRGIKVLVRDEPGYPRPLAGLPDPPLALYLKGEYREEDEAAVALVGCRKPDPYGESMAAALGSGLARYRITVVSGLARGIDAAAQSAALKAGGRSIAVLGTGVDVIYPPENQPLYEELTEKGAVLSEFPPGTPPEPGNFPRRNRIISGLSKGVVMVQAMSERSGALITVRHAAEQGREVYAVPGNAGSRAGRIGNSLLKQGAKLVETAEDVMMDLLNLDSAQIQASMKLQHDKTRAREIHLPDLQAKLFALVPSPAEGTVDADALARQAGASPAEAAGALLELELSGLVRALPGKRYVRLMD